MKFLDRNHPFFARRSVRMISVVFPALWAGVEFYHGSPGWAVVFGGASLWALWELFLRK